MTLTHKERFLRAINHEQADRVPTYAFKVETGFARAYEERYGNWDNFEWTQFTQDQTILVHLGIDATTDPGLGARPDPVAKFKSFQTPEGDWVGSDGRVHRAASDGRSFYHAGYWSSKDVWEKFPRRVPPPEEEFARFEKFYKHAIIAEDKIYVFPIIHGLHECNWLSLGYATFAKEIRRPTFYPAVIEDLHKCNVETCKRLLEIDPEMVIAFTDDIAQKDRLMVAPKYFGQFYQPWYKELFGMIHKRGGRTMIHTDGKIDELIPAYIAMGLDLLQGLEPAAGVDIIALNEQYGDKIAWNGNLDVSVLLWKGTPNEVHWHTRHIVEAIGPSNNLVLGPCTDIMNFHSIENIEALYEQAFAYDPVTRQFDYRRAPYSSRRHKLGMPTKYYLIKELEKIPRRKLEKVLKDRMGLDVRDLFERDSWEDVKDKELIDRLADICVPNGIYIKDFDRLNILYKNKDLFIIQKSAGSIDYHEEKLKAALTTYGLSDPPDYEELARIAQSVYDHIGTPRYAGGLQSSYWTNYGLLQSIKAIAKDLATINQRGLKTAEEYRQFLTSIEKAFDAADDHAYWDIMTR